MLDSITLYPCFLSSCSPPYWTHTRAELKSLSSRLRWMYQEGTCAIRVGQAWKWMVAILQFWEDEASSTDSIVYGGHEQTMSALAEYVFNTINPGLEPGSKITWDDIVTRTPWMVKWLYGMTAIQEKTVRHQALPVPGMSSDLEIALERRYSKHILSSSMGRGKLVIENTKSPVPSPSPHPPD